MLIFFMMSGALRSAGDAGTPLRLGVMMTVLNVVLNVVLIGGLGPIPSFGTTGAAMGTAIASGVTGVVFLVLLFSGRLVVGFSRAMSFRPDWRIIRELFRFGLPTGFQGIVMNIAGIMLLRFVGSLEHSAEAQAAYAIGYAELFSLITWTSVGLMGATAAVAGQNLRRGPTGPQCPRSDRGGGNGACRCQHRRAVIRGDTTGALVDLRPARGDLLRTGPPASEVPGCLGLFRDACPDLHRWAPGDR